MALRGGGKKGWNVFLRNRWHYSNYIEGPEGEDQAYQGFYTQPKKRNEMSYDCLSNLDSLKHLSFELLFV